MRIRYAFWLAVVGLGIAAMLVGYLINNGIKAAADIVAITGLFTSVLGTLVGAFFGLQIGSAGTTRERQERQKAQQVAERALAELDPARARAIIGGDRS
jgi:vacuolar-type H+-ATPase subunit I/STV1